MLRGFRVEFQGPEGKGRGGRNVPEGDAFLPLVLLPDPSGWAPSGVGGTGSGAIRMMWADGTGYWSATRESVVPGCPSVLAQICASREFEPPFALATILVAIVVTRTGTSWRVTPVRRIGGTIVIAMGRTHTVEP